MKPRQLGPHSTMPSDLAFSASASSIALPAAPISLKPEEKTTTARMPRLPSASTFFKTSFAGTATIARSAASGSASIDG